MWIGGKIRAVWNSAMRVVRRTWRRAGITTSIGVAIGVGGIFAVALTLGMVAGAVVALAVIGLFFCVVVAYLVAIGIVVLASSVVEGGLASLRVKAWWPMVLYSMTFLGLGVGVPILVLGVFLWKSLEADALGCGFISMGLGAAAWYIGLKSDKKMKAVARLELANTLGKVNAPDRFIAGTQRNVLYYLRGALEMAPWLDEGQKRDLVKEMALAYRSARGDDLKADILKLFDDNKVSLEKAIEELSKNLESGGDGGGKGIAS